MKINIFLLENMSTIWGQKMSISLWTSCLKIPQLIQNCKHFSEQHTQMIMESPFIRKLLWI